MPNYKINIDKPLPDKQQIAQHKDFERLYGRYQTATRFSFWQRLRTNPKYFASVVMIFAVGYLVWEASMSTDKPVKNYVSAPLPLDIPYATHSFNANSGFDFESPGGNKILVPPDAFIDTSGNAVTGNISLKYREIRDAKDMFIAGIPMEYDSAGQEYLLESTGMIQLTAYQEGIPLALKEGINVRVELFSESSGSDFSRYFLAEAAKNWQYMGRDSIYPLINTDALLDSLPPRPVYIAPPAVQDLTQNQAVEEDGDLELIPKGVRPPPAHSDARTAYESQLISWQKLYDQAEKAMITRSPARRVFTIHHLGYHCLGRRLAPAPLQTKVVLNSPNGKNLSRALGKAELDVFLVQRGINSLRKLTYTGEGSHVLAYYDDRYTMLWALSPDGLLAIVREDKTGDLATNDQQLEVIFSGPDFESLEAVRNSLDWADPELRRRSIYLQKPEVVEEIVAD